MSLEAIISNSSKEIAGSRTKNRLTVQISYAIQLIIEFYEIDFLILMDYIEDVSVICDPNHQSKIHLYQVKTKSSDKQYLLSTVIKDEWFQKLYKNAKKYEEYLGQATVVCNTDIVTSQSKSNTEVFKNDKTCLTEESIQSNINKIREAIAKDQNLDVEEIDLSKFYFCRSTLSTKRHKEEVEQQFQNFLYEQDEELQVATAKSIFSVLYEELDKRFNCEISEECTDVKEIYETKGLNSQDIKEIVTCGLAIQIPVLDKLYLDFNITSVSEKRKYMLKYRQIKEDMYSQMGSFLRLKKYLHNLIEKMNSEGIDDMPGLLAAVYDEAVQSQEIPSIYMEEAYLKILIMILIYKFCYGGMSE